MIIQRSGCCCSLIGNCQKSHLPLLPVLVMVLFSLSTLLENIFCLIKPHLLKYTVQWGLTVISSYKTTSKMQNISITSAKGVSCLCEVHFSPPPMAPGQHYSAFYHCRLVRILHKWGHTMPTSFVRLAFSLSTGILRFHHVTVHISSVFLSVLSIDFGVLRLTQLFKPLNTILLVLYLGNSLCISELRSFVHIRSIDTALVTNSGGQHVPIQVAQ